MFKKVIIIGICMVAAIGMVEYVEAAHSDGSDVSSERPDDIFNSRNKSSYETKLGLAPEKNALNSATADNENYDIEKNIIDIKKEKKKIISERKLELSDKSRLEKAKGEQSQSEREAVSAKIIARQKTEHDQKKIILAQGIFVALCLGMMWFFMSRPADS